MDAPRGIPGPKASWHHKPILRRWGQDWAVAPGRHVFIIILIFLSLITMTDKKTFWSVTAYNDEISMLENPPWPSFVLKVYGGKETCPETGKIHFQGMVHLRSQQRMSALKKWLPTAHWEPARNVDALKNYAMKQDTAVGDKKAVQNTVEHISTEKIMIKLANEWDTKDVVKYMEENDKLDVREASKLAYWDCVNRILSDSPPFRACCQVFARADTLTLWLNTKATWLKVKDEDCYSITQSDCLEGSEECPPVNEIVSGLIVQECPDLQSDATPPDES